MVASNSNGSMINSSLFTRWTSRVIKESVDGLFFYHDRKAKDTLYIESLHDEQGGYNMRSEINVTAF